ncbi:MAG TPA: methylmalonyl Co-A mutase-associated GTPase MeaB [Candidatus Thermoplasmatota archaeon]|nr:methylmalonyl Co-A mutase-associated GTPase MeaB [Candidatus Thermoplasmatota archaeon]
MSLAARIASGDRIAAARLISWAEDGDPRAREELIALHPRTGRAHVVGITGPPGSGKSSLVDRLIEHHRAEGRTVGVVAVDPTSPFTGGALLGDRVRMQARATDPGVFIRSMATRGALGGLARATLDAVRVLDALGLDVVLVETVGVGQAEIDVARLADTVVVVAVPGMGDEVQAIKAGLMEIGDVFVVNKGDREGADRAAAELRTWAEMGMTAEWIPPVLVTTATTGEGVKELADAALRHRDAMRASGAHTQRRRRQAEHELHVLLQGALAAALERDLAEEFRRGVDAVAERRESAHETAESLLRAWRGL